MLQYRRLFGSSSRLTNCTREQRITHMTYFPRRFNRVMFWTKTHDIRIHLRTWPALESLVFSSRCYLAIRPILHLAVTINIAFLLCPMYRYCAREQLTHETFALRPFPFFLFLAYTSSVLCPLPILGGFLA